MIVPMPNRARKHPVLSDDAIRLVAQRFRALGDPTRLRILNTLMQGESSVQGLVEATGRGVLEPCDRCSRARPRAHGIPREKRD